MSKQQNKKTGKLAETQAKNLLLNKGYKILGLNLSLPFGEVDILAQDNNQLVVVEVKYKKTGLFGQAEEMVTAKKKAKLVMLAHEFARKYDFENVRIDIIANNNGLVTHFINALEE